VKSYRLQAVEALREHPDLVLLTVKTQDVAQACRDIKPYVDGSPVVAMQNGVRADGLAAEVLGRERMVGAVVMCAATYLHAGEVSVEFPGWLVVGAPFQEGPEPAQVRAVTAVLRGAVPAYVTPHLARVRWSKLIANLNNALCAATGLLLSEIMREERGRALPLWVMREGYHVVRAAGIPLDHGIYGLRAGALRPGGDSTAALVALLQGSLTTMLAVLPERAALAMLTAAGRSRLSRLPVRFSTWQSIARGKATEIEYLNGEIVRLADRLGMPAPFNRRLVEAVRDVERSHTFWRVDDLLPGHGGAAPAAYGRRYP
jgi:2-dehydropantoate 2-reductase